MSKYGQVALDAVSLCVSTSQINPKDAWQTAAGKHFGKGTPSAEKGCPQSAFLGLCSEGYVKGIPPGKYVKQSSLNKQYAIDAVAILRQEPMLVSDIKALWRKVVHGEKPVHNQQMNVVVALWETGHIVL